MSSEEAAIPTFSLNVIDTVRGLQQQHGLKSYDFLRYRSYCTRRLRRIHKTLRLFAGTQKKYKGLTILPEDVTDVRVLEMLLLQAERAWAYAEQLRSDYATTDSAKQHRHYVSRIKKAQDHAFTFKKIADHVCDERTKKEVDAYVSEMKGHKSMSNKLWAEAKEQYVAAREVYIALQEGCKIGVRTSLAQRVTDLDQSLRFCTYNLGDDTHHGGDEAAPGIRQHGTVLQWRGQSIPVTSEKVRNLLSTAEVSVQEAETLSAQLTGSEGFGSAMNKCLDMYDRAFIAFNDAMTHVKQDIANEKEGDPALLHLLVNCLKYKLLEHTRDRNQVMIKAHAARLEGQSAKKKEGQKQTTALDLVRLHETIYQTIDAMLAIPGVEDDDEMADPLTAQQHLHTALKHFYQAETFKSLGEWAYAIPLYNAAVEDIGEALAFSQRKNLDSSVIMQHADRMRAARCICKATAAVQQSDDTEQEETAGRLDRDYATYRACDQITGIPPDYVSMAGRPIFLDMAKGALPKPSVEHRASQDKKGQKPSVKSQGAAKPSAKAGAAAAGTEDDKKGWFGGWGWGAGGAKQ